jgi:hypothetical protein
MLIPISMIVLGTQLVITVADDVPKYDIVRGCRLDSTQAFDLNAGMNESVKRCVADEQGAMAQLQTQWSQFRETDKGVCTGQANIGGTPSYVDLLTCLQLAKDARQLPK